MSAEVLGGDHAACGENWVAWWIDRLDKVDASNGSIFGGCHCEGQMAVEASTCSREDNSCIVVKFGARDANALVGGLLELCGDGGEEYRMNEIHRDIVRGRHGGWVGFEITPRSR
eukprot:scaffold263560_cov62-Attheya_sp.AAC.1